VGSARVRDESPLAYGAGRRQPVDERRQHIVGDGEKQQVDARRDLVRRKHRCLRHECLGAAPARLRHRCHGDRVVTGAVQSSSQCRADAAGADGADGQPGRPLTRRQRGHGGFQSSGGYRTPTRIPARGTR